MKSIRASNVEKYEQVIMPSFKLQDQNQELPRTMSHVKISEGDDGLQVRGGVQSAEIALISGSRPSTGSLKHDHADSSAATPGENKGVVIRDRTIVINDEFVFAVNDQDLEINHIEPSFVIAA